MNQPKPELNVKLSSKSGHSTAEGLLFQVLRGEADLVLERELAMPQHPSELQKAVELIIDQAVLEQVLPVGIKPRLIQQFRHSYVRLLDL